jgi:phosphonate transport system substrate-binding protein
MNSFHVGKFALVLIALLFGSPAAHTEESYTFAVVPQFEQRKLFTVWQPIVDELSRRTGYNLKLVATLTVPDFERELATGRFDFVYANPYHIMREGSRQGYVPLVRDQQALRGILVVRKDSSYKTPAELDGEKLAIPSFNALGASLLIRADLEQVFHAKTIPIDVKTHSSVYLQVANGLIPAGGGVEKTLREQDKAVQDMLACSTPPAKCPRIRSLPTPGCRPRCARCCSALLDLAATERKLLQRVPMAEPVATSWRITRQ